MQSLYVSLVVEGVKSHTPKPPPTQSRVVDPTCPVMQSMKCGECGINELKHIHERMDPVPYSLILQCEIKLNPLLRQIPLLTSTLPLWC